MSSILKALQKLEQDKAARSTREPDITSAIRMSGRNRKDRQVWFVPVLSIAVAIVSILVTFALMGGFATKRKGSIPEASQHAERENIPSGSPVNAVPQGTAVLPQASELRLPTDTPVNRGLPGPKAKSGAPTAVLPSPPSDRQPQPQAETEPPRPSQLQDPPAAAPQPKPKLKVNGIAWQSDSASRIAVVNGISVSEGSRIDDVKVEQISPDRVRFSRDGRQFEVQLEHEGESR